MSRHVARLVIWMVLAAGCGGHAQRAAAPDGTPGAALAGTAMAGEHGERDVATEPAAAPRATPIADAYREVAARIVGAALADEGAWRKLAYLTDRIGARLAGSQSLERAVEWAAQALRDDGHANVRREKVMVPHWVRGEERAELLAPVRRELAVLGLGGTVATPRRGLRAEVVVVGGLDELATLGRERVAGKVVLYDMAMPPYDPDKGAGYDELVEVRYRGAIEAAKLGAVAVMVRSLTARSLYTPHTGGMGYEDGVPKIPAVAVSIEDASLIARLAAAGETVEVALRTSGKFLADAESANVLGELPGRELPEQIVVVGAHLDSWDVGQGAHDDATGCAIAMQALTVLRALGLQPRRTIRVVLFTNEENGLRGAFQYAADHAGELADHVAAIESDGGGFAPRGFGVEGGEQAQAQAADIASLLAELGAARTHAGFGGIDLIPLARAGVPAIAHEVDGSTYFDIHHTHADTLDKVDPTHLRMNVAAVAVLAYVLADMPERFGAADRAARDASAPSP